MHNYLRQLNHFTTTEKLRDSDMQALLKNIGPWDSPC